MNFVEWLIDPRILVGAIIGAIVMLFVARKNPEWVQEIYEKQKNASRKVLSPVEQELAETKAKLEALELDKKVEAKAIEIYNKMKELGK